MRMQVCVYFCIFVKIVATEYSTINIKSYDSNFADKASDEMDRLWEENNWSNETMKAWGEEHMRTGTIR